MIFIVYEQRTPIPNGRRYDNDREDHDVNLVPLGIIHAKSNDDAWSKAKSMTPNPVLEEMEQ